MSEASSVAERPVAISMVEAERRVALTRGSDRLSIQDQLDWGDELLAAGDRASARLLMESAFIQEGFSPQLERTRASRYAALQIDARQDAQSMRDQIQGNTVDIAIAELRLFARAHGELIAASASASLGSVVGKTGLHPTAKLVRGASLPTGDGVADLVTRTFSWLRSSVAAQADDAGALAVEALLGSERDPQRWTVAGLAGAATPVLANGLVVQEMRAFLRASSDLLMPRLGSPALFRASATFESSGLGPYFGNVGQIVRSSANLFELAGIALDASGAAGDEIAEQAWVALLSRGLSNWLRFDIIDELGDRNAAFALTLILERAVAVAADDVDRLLVARIRDAALDNLDYELAGSAQQALVNLSGDDRLERRIMGAIQASAGRVAAADQLLSACLQEDPGDEWLAREVVANRERRYAPFVLVKGFGSPSDRQLKRIGARAARV